MSRRRKGKWRRGLGDAVPLYALTACACGKLAYVSRAVAKQNAASLHPGQRMRVYQCDQSSLWHLTSRDAATAEYWRDRNAAHGIG